MIRYILIVCLALLTLLSPMVVPASTQPLATVYLDDNTLGNGEWMPTFPIHHAHESWTAFSIYSWWDHDLDYRFFPGTSQPIKNAFLNARTQWNSSSNGFPSWTGIGEEVSSASAAEITIYDTPFCDLVIVLGCVKATSYSFNFSAGSAAWSKLDVTLTQDPIIGIEFDNQAGLNDVANHEMGHVYALDERYQFAGQCISEVSQMESFTTHNNDGDSLLNYIPCNSGTSGPRSVDIGRINAYFTTGRIEKNGIAVVGSSPNRVIESNWHDRSWSGSTVRYWLYRSGTGYIANWTDPTQHGSHRDQVNRVWSIRVKPGDYGYGSGSYTVCSEPLLGIGVNGDFVCNHFVWYPGP